VQANVKVSGTFKAGKMYVGNGRWAKVLVTHMVSRSSLISIAFGVINSEGHYEPAFDSRMFDLKRGYQNSLASSAYDYVETGRVEV
jgi:hypothetical protein